MKIFLSAVIATFSQVAIFQVTTLPSCEIALIFGIALSSFAIFLSFENK